MLNTLVWHAPSSLEQTVKTELDRQVQQDAIARLWRRDATLWTGQDEGQWLGWLDAIEQQRAALPQLQALAADVRQARFTHALLLGMGGSSLCPEVLARTFGHQRGFPELHVLDSTVPEQVLAVEGRVDLARTLIIVASKSGSTLEPNVFKQYFFDRLAKIVGRSHAGRQFVAITDPKSKMQQVAEGDGFRHIFFGEPSIGGRYSALSPFGTVPAAVLGLDVAAWLDRAALMAEACKGSGADNPGLQLGVLLGVAAREGRDKLTVFASPGIEGVGGWLEQLIAESTGKDGKGIIPVDLEPIAEPSAYGSDRLFAYVRLTGAPDEEQDRAAEALAAAGHPVIRIDVREPLALGQEFFRWEIATAVAGAILGIHPFNQPDVEASKIETRKLTEAFEHTGILPGDTPIASSDGLTLFADAENAGALQDAVAAGGGVREWLRAHVARLQDGDYFALLAYVEMNARHAGLLRTLREIVRAQHRTATCLGFGPRFLHSTGQAYKGGPASGVFLQITSDAGRDMAVPDQRYTFGVVRDAQAAGDLAVLASRHRRALRVHLDADVAAGLQQVIDVLR